MKMNETYMVCKASNRVSKFFKLDMKISKKYKNAKIVKILEETLRKKRKSHAEKHQIFV